MKFITTTMLTFLFMTNALASTFVGNGGNAGDVELQVTLSQLTKTLSEIAASTDDHQGELCRCQKVMNTHKICDSLESLSRRQVYYCGDTLSQKADELLKLIQSPAGVQVVWTEEEIDVMEKSGERRADAVAQFTQASGKKGSKIFLNQHQFLSLKDYERIFLLSHELGHLVKIEKHFLRDDESVGPFEQEDGGRQLLNSMAAAVTMKSITNGQVSNYTSTLSRSKNYKNNWLILALGSDYSRNDTSTFAIKKYQSVSASYRRQLTQEIGMSIEHLQFKGQDDYFTMTKAESEIKLTNLQLNYRIFPFKDPLSFIGQSHVVLGAGYEAGTADLKVSDAYTDIKEKANLGSAVLSANYYFPIRVGIWSHGGVHYSMHHYEFSNIGYESSPNQMTFNLGVSYGF